MRRLTVSLALLLTLPVALLVHAQGTPPPVPLTLLAADTRRPIPTTLLAGQEMVALEDLAAIFQVSVREDALAGGVTVTYKGRTIVISPEQPMASVNGRVVTLPAPLTRVGRRALVPVEFMSRALGPIYDQRIELRKASRLVLLGNLRVPRVTARIETPGPPTRVVVEVAPAAPVTIAVEAGRVILRVDADALDAALPAAGGGLVDQFRPGDGNSIAVLLNARAGAPKAASSTDDNVTRVTIDVAAQTDAPQEGPPPETPMPADVPPALTPPVTALQAIVIDPGHGGADQGARGPGGAVEKTITLDVARRVKAVVESRLGIRVILTREDDRAVGPDERAAVANNSKADLFLSLHANAALAPSVAGAEVFHLRVDSELAEARRAADAESATLPALGGATRRIDVIRWDMAQARHVDASGVLAGMLHAALRERVPMGPRPLQAAPMRVLVGVNMPAALVEMGFLTNPAQEKALASDELQANIAQAIYDVIVRFRGYLEGRR